MKIWNSLDAPRDPLTDESLALGFGTLTEVLQELRTCSGMFATLSPNSDNRSRRLRRFERSISRRNYSSVVTVTDLAPLKIGSCVLLPPGHRTIIPVGGSGVPKINTGLSCDK